MKNTFYQWRQTLSILALLLLASSVNAVTPRYDYPFDDPHTATVVGTPKDWQTTFAHPAPLTAEQLPRLSQLPLPEVFWYQDTLHYSTAWQEGEAPLIFVIAGTGSGHDGGTMRTLANTWFDAGYHVVLLSSPTYANFIATASSSGVPGRLHQDAIDLYQVMEQITERHDQRKNGKRQISNFSVSGYSLGGAHAAYIGQLDNQRQRFNFARVLLINPPVSLYNSVVRLDNLLQNNLDFKDPTEVDRFVTNAFDRVAKAYVEDDSLAMDDDILYTLYRKLGPDQASLDTLIGTAFRLSSSNMLFTADVMTSHGFLKPAQLELQAHDPLTDYLKAAMRISFIEYFDQFFLPFFRQRTGPISREAMIDELSLYPLTHYLRTDKRVEVVTNADDLILDQTELDWLKATFGDRATIFPNGGHCGNMAHPAFTHTLQQSLLQLTQTQTQQVQPQQPSARSDTP
ncbi:MAG: alpha/beta hydrolase [Marinobacterium sp.]|nr:alpha/beta hydrolase [Marinobacterium sp.]